MAGEAPKNKDLSVLLRISELVQSPFQLRFDEVVATKTTTRTYFRNEKEMLEESELDTLAKSIQNTGLMQPIVVRAVEKGYEIIDSHRRVEAMKRLGRGQISALVKDVSDRVIRLSSPVGKNGVSNAQWKLYRKVIFSKMGRKELALHIRKSDKTPALKTWRMKSANKKITISLETGKMDQLTKEKLMKLITEKMKEISDSL